eukprot:TRINITY_DN14461_c0_g1_i2.p1 TRINITY_DN14461_c0_g1~~TRINITY_DN14461_c0_g1_i2.p1  ORF type:complete len:368 (+),score=63.32 TRINITY_DN14461_c0_g1_i2:23-1126(+)
MDRAAERLGLCAVTLGAACAVLANSLAKLQAHMPVLQLMQERFLLQFLVTFILVLVLWLCKVADSKDLRSFESGHLLIARAMTSTIATGALWASLRRLPVGECTAILFMYPIITSVLAKMVLGEQLGGHFLPHASINLFGVLLVMRPQQGMNFDTWGVGFACLACLSFALTHIFTRMLRGTSSRLTLQLWQDTLAALVFVPFAQAMTVREHFPWSRWNVADLPLLLAFTLAGLAASLFFIWGYSLAPAGKAALFMYIEVPLAYAVDVACFHEKVVPVRVAGAALVTFAALFRYRGELQHGHQEPIVQPRVMSVGETLTETFEDSSDLQPLVPDGSLCARLTSSPAPYSTDIAASQLNRRCSERQRTV